MSSPVDSSTNLRQRVVFIASRIANGYSGVPGQVAVGGGVVLPAVAQHQNNVAGRLDDLLVWPNSDANFLAY
jgi:hypothetical protein